MSLSKAGNGVVDNPDPADYWRELFLASRFGSVGFVCVAERFRELVDLYLERWARFGNQRRARPAESLESPLDSTPAPNQFLSFALEPGDAAARSYGVSQSAGNLLLQIDRGAGIFRGTRSKYPPEPIHLNIGQ